MPEYAPDARLKIKKEVNPPPDVLYMGLGWDENGEDETLKKKHYRQFYNDELENNKEYFPNGPSPFNSYELKRG